MSPDAVGIISGVIGIPMMLIAIWLIYVVHAYTEKSERMMPKSSFVKANIDTFSQAGFIGKAIRNGFLTIVLLTPECSHKRGIVDLTEVRDFPAGLKCILIMTWGACGFIFLALVSFGVYIKYWRLMAA